MSRLTELIYQVKNRDSQLGLDLEREFKILAGRRAFGLNFERHRPEAVELPHHEIRKGDKVRILVSRGATSRGDQKLWSVKKLERTEGGRVAHLERMNGEERVTKRAPAEDLVFVAEFRDYIFPGLVSTDVISRGNGKPFHTIINAENYHGLKALSFTHRGKIDAIYIDPPYNTGAKDWKYNNDYVEADDLYRHSKWLAFMERRLRLAKDLLNPLDSVLIVSIDEKEVHRLGLLLEQIFVDADIQMVTSIISAKGAVRVGKFSRVEEHIFIVTHGAARANPWFRNMLDPVRVDDSDVSALEYLGLRRREPSSVRGSRPNQFYPIFVHADTGFLHSIGDPIEDGIDRETIVSPPGTMALWPLKPNGEEMIWGLTPEVLRRNWANGYARVSWNARTRKGTVKYLPGGTISLIQDGTITITGRNRDGSVIGSMATDEEVPPPKRVWNLPSHNAETGGTNVLSCLIPRRRFPYPKSLYAVEDVLRFFVGDKPDAVILDFFSGSGTAAHAVMRLNRQDNGRRQSISITNNEVAAEEQAELRKSGLRPGDPDWEKWGICEYITKPRLKAAITGMTPDGMAVDGDYKYTDEFPMAEGFAENAEFFNLSYETTVGITHNLAFSRIAPLLWMRAGSLGRRIDEIPNRGWDVADCYALLTDLDRAAAFSQAVASANGLRVAYIVTDDEHRFQAVVRQLPATMEIVRLYESYLLNFQFTNGD